MVEVQLPEIAGTTHEPFTFVTDPVAPVTAKPLQLVLVQLPLAKFEE